MAHVKHRGIGNGRKRQVRVLISLDPIARRFRVSDRPLDPPPCPLERQRLPHPLWRLVLLLFLPLSLDPLGRPCSNIPLFVCARSCACGHRFSSRMLCNLRFWIMLPSRWSNDRSIGSGLPSLPVSALRLASTYRCHFRSYESTVPRVCVCVFVRA